MSTGAKKKRARGGADVADGVPDKKHKKQSEPMYSPGSPTAPCSPPSRSKKESKSKSKPKPKPKDARAVEKEGEEELREEEMQCALSTKKRRQREALKYKEMGEKPPVWSELVPHKIGAIASVPDVVDLLVALLGEKHGLHYRLWLLEAEGAEDGASLADMERGRLARLLHKKIDAALATFFDAQDGKGGTLEDLVSDVTTELSEVLGMSILDDGSNGKRRPVLTKLWREMQREQKANPAVAPALLMERARKPDHVDGPEPEVDDGTDHDHVVLNFLGAVQYLLINVFTSATPGENDDDSKCAALFCEILRSLQLPAVHPQDVALDHAIVYSREMLLRLVTVALQSVMDEGPDKRQVEEEEKDSEAKGEAEDGSSSEDEGAEDEDTREAYMLLATSLFKEAFQEEKPPIDITYNRKEDPKHFAHARDVPSDRQFVIEFHKAMEIFGERKDLQERWAKNQGKCVKCNEEIDYDDGGPNVKPISDAEEGEPFLKLYCGYCSTHSGR